MPALGLRSRFVQRLNARRGSGRRDHASDRTRDRFRRPLQDGAPVFRPRFEGLGAPDGARDDEQALLSDGRVDLEASRPLRREFRREAMHLADEPTYTQTTTQEEKEDKIVAMRDIKRNQIEAEVARRIDELKSDGKDFTNDRLCDTEIRMQDYAKDEILKCESTAELLMKAELLIDESWLANVDALPGNLFALGAFGDLVPRDAEWLSPKMIKGISKLIGCTLIVVIQIVAPPLIFLSMMPGNIGMQTQKAVDWRCWPFPMNPMYDPESDMTCPGGMPANEVSLFEDWEHIKTTRMLGIIFCMAFILNGIFVIFQELNTWQQVYSTFRFLDLMNDDFVMSGRTFLLAGTFINCWVICWSCVNMYVILGSSTDPMGLVSNALGMIFLYNLDDIGGDLGFVVEDDWPALRLAWIFQEMVEKWPSQDEQDEEGRKIKGFDKAKVSQGVGLLGSATYMASITLLLLMSCLVPALIVITPFTQMLP